VWLHRLFGISIYRQNGLWQEDDHTAYSPLMVHGMLFFTKSVSCSWDKERIKPDHCLWLVLCVPVSDSSWWLTGRKDIQPAKKPFNQSQLVSWSLTSPFSTNMAISETKGQEVESYPYPVKEGRRYINLNPGHLFVQQPPKKGKGSRGSFSTNSRGSLTEQAEKENGGGTGRPRYTWKNGRKMAPY